MGKRISKYEYQLNVPDGLIKPIIFCYTDENLEKNAIALNILIAEKLVNIKPARRSFKLPGIIDSIIASLPDNCLVKDFDVLFNPEYQIDVLQVLVAACKKKNFSIRWPGTYNDGKLMYAETCYSDFKTFDLDKYDVTCVV